MRYLISKINRTVAVREKEVSNDYCPYFGILSLCLQFYLLTPILAIPFPKYTLKIVIVSCTLAQHLLHQFSVNDFW